MSCGKLRMACGNLVTNIIAASLLSRLNSTVVELLPCELDDVMFLIPSDGIYCFQVVL
jgi:hypothetical protein